MFITADQILAHLLGDYILQSHWMAQNKAKQSFAAAVHAVTYTLPFIFITRSFTALALICGSHFLVDRFRLARWVVWFKNGYMFSTSPHYVHLHYATDTGYREDLPPWLAVWLLIIADNTLHLVCNGAALALT
jgi:hypothetical protein